MGCMHGPYCLFTPFETYSGENPSRHEKFFCDSLVDLGKLPDDNDDYILESHYYTGSVDVVDPRVEIFIEL